MLVNDVISICEMTFHMWNYMLLNGRKNIKGLPNDCEHQSKHSFPTSILEKTYARIEAPEAADRTQIDGTVSMTASKAPRHPPVQLHLSKTFSKSAVTPDAGFEHRIATWALEICHQTVLCSILINTVQHNYLIIWLATKKYGNEPNAAFIYDVGNQCTCQSPNPHYLDTNLCFSTYIYY